MSLYDSSILFNNGDMTMKATEDQIHDMLAKIKKQKSVKYIIDTDLSAQGLDSLDMIDLLFQIQEKYDVQVPEAMIENNELSSIEKILNYINS